MSQTKSPFCRALQIKSCLFAADPGPTVTSPDAQHSSKISVINCLGLNTVSRFFSFSTSANRVQKTLRSPIPDLNVEEHGLGRNWPGEVDCRLHPVGPTDSILQRALIKAVGRELGQIGVHPVLDLEADGFHSE
jgi:hypothetical protein